jgi:predicted ATPase/DNA-binding XRE family transcriptional regulator
MLRRLRHERNLTQVALAQKLACSLDTIKKLETGARRPSRKLSAQIADAFDLGGMEREEFLNRDRNIGSSNANLTVTTVCPPTGDLLITARNSLPLQFTSFIGREDELEALTRLLAEPTCRLITVTGPGGIGKTRTAIELASRLLTLNRSNHPSFADGVWFVHLEMVDSPEGIILAIANTLQCPSPGDIEQYEHLINYLQAKELLLVLDNFERLQRWADLLLTILVSAPQVKFLITSREALNLTQEWRFPLDGLPLHSGDDHEHIPGEMSLNSATHLFIERTRRLLPTFDFISERAAIQRICQFVEGVPLAIELAATWMRVLPPSVIADELQGDLSFLTSTMRHTPERHRSMQAVFARSWELLSEEEQHVFARLSVFQTGFQRAAAEEITGATLKLLTSLIDKSLLRWEAKDRYRVHELLRQYAAEKMKHLEISTETCERHSAYYARFLARREADLNGRRQRQTLSEIAAEFDNVRAAWRYASQHQRIADLRQAAYGLYLFYECSNRYQEGFELYEQTVQQLDKLIENSETKQESKREFGALLAELLCYSGWHSIRLGELQRARTLLERSQALLTQWTIPPRVGLGVDPLVALGTLANTIGDYTEAARLGEEARQRSEANHDWGNLVFAYYVLANAAFARGYYTEARQYAIRAYSLAEQFNEQWFVTYLVADLGNVARAMGDYVEAARQYQIGYTISEGLDDSEGIAFALSNLGQVLLLQADHKTAQLHFQRSLTIYREIGNQGGKVTALYGLGMVAFTAGNYDQASQFLHESLQIAISIGYAPRIQSILVGIAELFLNTGESLRAAELLVTVLRDTDSNNETCDRARMILPRCKTLLSPEQYAVATHGRHTLDLAGVSAALQRVGGHTNTLLMAAAENITIEASSHRIPVGVSYLLKPLTERELSVLRLIAAGHSNRQIAAQLIITTGTVKWYVSEILSKLGVHSRTQAIGRAQELGLLI